MNKTKTREKNEQLTICWLCGATKQITFHHLDKGIPTLEQRRRINKGTLLQDDKGIGVPCCRNCHDAIEWLKGTRKFDKPTITRTRSWEGVNYTTFEGLRDKLTIAYAEEFVLKFTGDKVVNFRRVGGGK